MRWEKLRKRFNQPGTLVFWILSYIVVLALPLAVYAASMMAVTAAAQERIHRNSTTVISQLRRVLDSRVEDALRLRDYLRADASLEGLFPLRFPLEAKDRYRLWQASKTLYTQICTSSLVSSGYLYIWDTDKALCNGSIYGLDLVMSVVHGDDMLGIDAWRNELRQYTFGTFRAVECRDGTCRIALLSSVPAINLYKTQATLVLLLENDSYLGDVNDMQHTADSTFYLLDGESRVLTCSDGVATTPPVQYERLLNASGSFTLDISGAEALVSYATSGKTGWKYCSVTPLRSIWDEQRYTQNLLLGTVVFTAALGLLMAYCLARRKMQFFDGILRKLRGGVFGESEDPRPVDVDRLLNDLIHSRRSLDALVERQNSLLRRHAVERLLIKRAWDGETDSTLLASLGVTFSGNCFLVVLLYINETLEIGLSTARREEILLSAAERVLNQCASWAKGYALMTESMSAVLFNPARDRMGEEGQAVLERALGEVRDVLRADELLFGAGVSTVHVDLSGIHDAYLEALSLVNYALLSPVAEQSVLIAQDRCGQAARLFLTSLQEDLLRAAVSSGQTEATERLLDDICQPLHSMPVDPVMAQCFFYDVAAGAMKGMNPNDVTPDMTRELQELDRDGTLQRKESLLRLLVTRMTSRCTQPDAEHTLIDDILATIRERYVDPDFTVSRLADELNRNASYLSKYFRDNTGVGLYDYITRMRVNRAKELIDQRDEPVSKLIREAGFENAGSFIRVFKKYEGVTPGAYQKEKGQRSGNGE